MEELQLGQSSLIRRPTECKANSLQSISREGSQPAFAIKRRRDSGSGLAPQSRIASYAAR